MDDYYFFLHLTLIIDFYICYFWLLAIKKGGPDGNATNPVSVETMLHVLNGNVIGDNMWLWRADHSDAGPVTYDSNPVHHGLVVDGDDVTM